MGHKISMRAQVLLAWKSQQKEEATALAQGVVGIGNDRHPSH